MICFATPRPAGRPGGQPAPICGTKSKAAHLHRRAGLGATWSQVRRDIAEGFELAVRRVLEVSRTDPTDARVT